MKNENNTQRPSPSNPQEQAEPRLEAGEGLDVTACSASSLLDVLFEDGNENMLESHFLEICKRLQTKEHFRKITRNMMSNCENITMIHSSFSNQEIPERGWIRKLYTTE